MSSTSRSFIGKTAIVTGSSRGIGAAIALDLGRRGANVIVNYVSDRSLAAATGVVEDIRAAGSKAAACQTDLTKLEELSKLIQAALDISETGKIEILVHNAAVGRDALLKDTTMEFYNEHVDCNLRGVYFLTQKILPHLPRGGRIVMVTSICARMGLATQGVYSATKAANEALARVWAKELGQEYGVTVNCVNPGPVVTDQWNASTELFLQEMKPVIESTPAEARVGQVEDIAPLVSFLCSEEARWVTGSVLSANGGLCN